MNNERPGDDSWICEDCGKRNWPEVGMSWCDCKLERIGAYHEANRKPESRFQVPARHQAQLAMFSASYGSSEVKPDIKLKYEFIVHQTDKAILFAFKGEHGVYQQWLPRSVITAQTDKKVSVKSWFARRFV